MTANSIYNILLHLYTLIKVLSTPGVTCENSEHDSRVDEFRSHLHAVLDLPGVVPDDEGWLHDGRKLNVAVSLVLPLELVQQSLVGGLREAVMEQRKSLSQISRNKFHISFMWEII